MVQGEKEKERERERGGGGEMEGGEDSRDRETALERLEMRPENREKKVDPTRVTRPPFPAL